MHASTLLLSLALFLTPPAIILTTGLYLYAPLLDCTFPVATQGAAGCSIPGQQRAAVAEEKAPFRLLTLADPQLEGDSSLPTYISGGSGDGDGWFEDSALGLLWKEWGYLSPTIMVEAGRLLAKDIQTLPSSLEFWSRYCRKKLDLWGNDLYLSHIYRNVRWWSDPTHTVVLGDLLGSQHLSDEEFKRRSGRFWGTVFKGAEKVPGNLMGSSGRREVLGQDAEWGKRLMVVPGNHDIGYAGEVNDHLISRFEEEFGGVNWDIRFRLLNETNRAAASGSSSSSSPLRGRSGLGSNAAALFENLEPELHLILLNSMNLDIPAKDSQLQKQTHDFLAQALHGPPSSGSSHNPNVATVLLTHIPLHKPSGLCTDAPYFSYFADGTIKEQNHLSEEMSDYILDGLSGNANAGEKGRGKGKGKGKAIVLNGHDHMGCDTYHYLPQAQRDPQSSETSDEVDDSNKGGKRWQAAKIPPVFPITPKLADFDLLSASDDTDHIPTPGIREITVSAMQGTYSGTAGFLSGWFDYSTSEWMFEYRVCYLGVQHFWWGIHVLDAVVVGCGILGMLAGWLEGRGKTKRREVKRVEEKKGDGAKGAKSVEAGGRKGEDGEMSESTWLFGLRLW